MTIHAKLGELKHRLQSVGTDDQTVILIADQAALAHHKAFRRFAQLTAAHSLLHESATAFDGASPLAIDITELFARQETFYLGELLHAAIWACGISVIVTPLPFADALMQLRARCHVMLPDDFEAVLRYFDTRILPVLLQVLDTEQRAAFTGLCCAWLYLDRDGAWCTADSPVMHALVKPMPSLRLSPAQQDALIDAGECDAVLDCMRKMPSTALSTMSAPEQYRQVAALVEKAHGHGIDATANVALFCMIELSEVGQQDASTAWQEGLHAVREGNRTFEELLKEMA